jgi:anti-sigma B factor antagonist
MDLQEHADGTLAIIALSGRFTINDAPGMLRNAVAAALARGAVAVLLDLSAVQYVDSTRLGELIAAHVSVTKQGRRLKLIGTPDRLSALLKLAGLSGMFEQFPDVDTARRSLG